MLKKVLAVSIALSPILFATSTWSDNLKDEVSVTSHNPDYISSVFSTNTLEKIANADEEGFAHATKLVLGRHDDQSLKKIGLNTSDIELVRSVDVGRSTVIDEFRELAAAMRAELSSDAINAEKLGVLIHDLRVSEQRAYASSYRNMLNSLSSNGKAALAEKIEQEASSLKYHVHDFRAIAISAPAVVIETAQKVIDGIDAYEPQESNEREPRFVRKGSWVVQQ